VNLEIAKYIDHTLLSPQATRGDIIRLCNEAKEYNFHAVCINPYYVRQAVKELSASKVAVATVIGFPLGSHLTDVKIAEAQRAVSEGAEELDVVINIGALKDGEIDYVTEEIKAVVKVGKDNLIKVIIECDLLTDDEKVAATHASIKAGAHMIKTSTGYVKDGRGATVEDVLRLKEIIGNANIGIKASAGIRDYDKAKALIDAGATRLGTSAGIAIIMGSQAVAVAF
jgi:deoxyribose-phosphate aldolase